MRVCVFSQVGSLSWRALLSALPITLHIEAILHANNHRDIAEDLAAGVKTIASRLGPKGSFRFYQGLIALPFLAPLKECFQHSLLAGLPLLVWPKAKKLISDFKEGRMVGLPKRTAKFQFLFGALLTIGMLIPSPSAGSIIAYSLRWSLAKMYGHGRVTH